MTKVLKGLNELREVRALLDKHGHPAYKLSPLGVIRSTLCRYWAYEAVVDQWPEFKALILRPNREKRGEFGFKYTDVYLYSLDPNAMENLLKVPDVLPWNENFSIPACSVALKDVIKQAALKHGGRIEHSEEQYEAYVPRNPELIKSMKIPTDEYTFGRLEQKHSELVYEHWGSPRKQDKSVCIPYISDIIRNHPTACAYDKERNPISWVLTHYEGCGGFAYTMPEHRGKRVYGLVGVYVAQQAYKAGFTYTFAYGALSNINIQKSVDKAWLVHPGYIWFGRYLQNFEAKL